MLYTVACAICAGVQVMGMGLAVHCYVRERQCFHWLAAASRFGLLVWLVTELVGGTYDHDGVKASAVLLMAACGLAYQWSAMKHLARRITTIVPGKNGELHFVSSTVAAPAAPLPTFDDEPTERLGPPYRS